MGLDDGIDSYRGREAEWVALCAFDGVQSSDEAFQASDAPTLIESVWDFVTQNCEEEGIELPSKAEAISELKVLISNS